jgi:hypothetical protein
MTARICALKSALQALRTSVFGGGPDPGLRPGLPETGPSGLNRKRGRAEPTERGPEALTMLRNPHHAPKTARGPRCPQGLKGRFQQSCVRKHVAPVHDRENMRALKSALQALRTNVFGGPDPGLRRGLPETGPSGLNCNRGQAEPTERDPEAHTTRFMWLRGSRGPRGPEFHEATNSGLKGRFQRSQVRKHLVWAPPKSPRGLKGRFQDSEVRRHVDPGA